MLLFFFMLVLSKYFEVKKELDSLKTEHQFLQNKVLHLEKDVRDEANKNIILQSLLNQRDHK